MPWETRTTTLDVAIALADDAGLQLAVDEGDVVRDLVLESGCVLRSRFDLVAFAKILRFFVVRSRVVLQPRGDRGD